MYVHVDAKAVYLAHPRTASHATAEALKGVGFRRLDPPFDHHSKLDRKHLDSTFVLDASFDHHSSLDGAELGNGWSVATTVRNHWDALTSWMLVTQPAERRGRPWTVEEIQGLCARENWWINNGTMWARHGADADIVMRFETIQDDLNGWLSFVGLPQAQMRPVNVTQSKNGRKYQDFYTQETAQYVGDRFAAEIAAFGYSFN